MLEETIPPGATPVGTSTTTATVTPPPPAGATPGGTDLHARLAELERQDRNRSEELERLRKYKAEADKREADAVAAQMSDLQKAQKATQDATTKAQQYEARLQQQALQLAGYRHGATLGIGDVAAALALVQAEHGSEVTYSADGQPENIEDLLKAVLKAHPLLAAQQTTPRSPAASSGGATNPGRQQSGGLTLEQIKAMPMRERIARMAEIEAWQKAQQQQ